MSIEHVIRGRENRKSGEIFERWLMEACDYYWKSGVACIEKTPEPMIPIKPYGTRNRGQFVAYYSKKAQPDFKGVLSGGRCVIFDAKHTINEQIGMGVVSDGQKDVFDRYEAMGAYCWIIVAIASSDFYRVPWSVWKNMKELFGHRHMTKDELEPYRIPMKGMDILFLEGVEI